MGSSNRKSLLLSLQRSYPPIHPISTFINWCIIHYKLRSRKTEVSWMLIQSTFPESERGDHWWHRSQSVVIHLGPLPLLAEQDCMDCCHNPCCHNCCQLGSSDGQCWPEPAAKFWGYWHCVHIEIEMRKILRQSTVWRRPKEMGGYVSLEITGSGRVCDRSLPVTWIFPVTASSCIPRLCSTDKDNSFMQQCSQIPDGCHWHHGYLRSHRHKAHSLLKCCESEHSDVVGRRQAS